MLYGLEIVSITKRPEMEAEMAESKMLRLLMGVTRIDSIGNKYIRGTAHVEDRIEVVWACAEEGCIVYQEKDVED